MTEEQLTMFHLKLASLKLLRCVSTILKVMAVMYIIFAIFFTTYRLVKDAIARNNLNKIIIEITQIE